MSGIWPAPTRTVAEAEDPTERYAENVARAMREMKVDHAKMQDSNIALAVFKRAKQLDPSAAGEYQRFALDENR
jgi:hypothetical protein